MIIIKPRYRHIQNTVLQFMLNQGVKKYPINIKKLAEKNGWELISLKSLKEDKHLSLYALNISDAITFYNSETMQYKIVYDDSVRPTQRIRFSLAHEIGHILLKHLEKQNIPQGKQITLINQNEIVEQEADFFAANLLSSNIILKALGINSVQQLMRLCGITKSAAVSRLKNYDKWKGFKIKSQLEYSLLENFEQFIKETKGNI